MKKRTYAIKVVSVLAIAASCGIIIGAISEPQAIEVDEPIENTVEVNQTLSRGAEKLKKAQAKEVELSDGDREMLERLITAEAESESLIGQALVGRVVLNRVASPDFPDTVEGVIFEDKQFSVISNGRFDRVDPEIDAYCAVNLICSGWDESQGATYFEAVGNESTWHEDNLVYLFTEGGHKFYK